MIGRAFRLDPHQALRRSLAAIFGGAVSGIADEPWSSATFEGRRHRLRIASPDRLERIGTIGEIEFTLPGHFVAEIAIAEREERADGLDLIVEALTIGLD